MEADHKKRMRDAVGRASNEILNNGSAGGTNDTVPDLSMPSQMSESFDEKKIVMTGFSAKTSTGRKRILGGI